MKTKTAGLHAQKFNIVYTKGFAWTWFVRILRMFTVKLRTDLYVFIFGGREFQTYDPEKAKLILYRSVRVRSKTGFLFFYFNKSFCYSYRAGALLRRSHSRWGNQTVYALNINTTVLYTNCSCSGRISSFLSFVNMLPKLAQQKLISSCLQTLSMWGCHFNSSSVVTLRTLCSRTCSIIFVSRVRLSIRGLSRCLRLEANTMLFVFPGWSTMRFWSHYFDTSFKPSWGNNRLIPYLPYVNKSSCRLQNIAYNFGIKYL